MFLRSNVARSRTSTSTKTRPESYPQFPSFAHRSPDCGLFGVKSFGIKGEFVGVADLHSTIDVRCLMILDDALDPALAEVSASGSW